MKAMKLNAYSILDSKAKSYTQPRYWQHDGEALRAFQLGVQKGDSIMAACPEDYSFYKVGSFDDQSGIFTSIKPVYIGKALDYVAEKNGKLK